MKKVFLFACVLTAGALAFAGCGSKNETTERQEEPEITQHTAEETPKNGENNPTPPVEENCPPEWHGGYFYGFEIIFRVPEPFYKGVCPADPPVAEDGGESGNTERRRKTPKKRLPKKSGVRIAAQ